MLLPRSPRGNRATTFNDQLLLVALPLIIAVIVLLQFTPPAFLTARKRALAT
jgi:hypothetical protein